MPGFWIFGGVLLLGFFPSLFCRVLLFRWLLQCYELLEQDSFLGDHTQASFWVFLELLLSVIPSWYALLLVTGLEGVKECRLAASS